MLPHSHICNKKLGHAAVVVTIEMVYNALDNFALAHPVRRIPDQRDGEPWPLDRLARAMKVSDAAHEQPG